MSGTAVNQVRGGPIDTGHFPSLYSRLYDKIIAKTMKLPKENMPLFAQMSGNETTYRIGEIFDDLPIPPRNTDTEAIPEAAPVEGNYITITAYQYALGRIVTEDALKSQKTRLIAQVMNGLPKAFTALFEEAGVNVLMGAFDTTVTGDGGYLCDVAHAYEDAMYGTYSNRPAAGGDFNTDTWLAAWKHFQNLKTVKGEPAPIDKEFKVMYHPDKEEDVAKVKGSDQYPDDALNAKMPKLFHQFTPMRNHYFTSTSPWFAFSVTGDSPDNGLIWYWKEKENYRPYSDSKNPRLVMGRFGQAKFGVGCLHGRNVFGNPGS